MHFSGSKLTWNSKPLVDLSSPDFLHQTQEELPWFVTSADFGYLQPFRRYSRSKSEVVQNLPKFCMFLAPEFFFFWGGEGPLFLDLHYKIHADSDQVAKLQGDRSRELGERWAKERKKKERKNIRGKT